LKLDTRKRATMRALQNLNMFHGAVERAVDATEERKLWRIDNVAGTSYIMILSATKPNMKYMEEQFGDGTPAVTKVYDKYIDQIENGSQWRFRLVANPTIKIKVPNKNRSVARAHITPEYQKAWLMNRAEKYGFRLNDDSFDVKRATWYNFEKNAADADAKHITMLSVTFEGLLNVTDADKFRELLVMGIGREKAYGHGMITVAAV